VDNKIALVTGANKGIGFEVARELSKIKGITVILCARNKESGINAVSKLKKEGSTVDFFQLDVTDLNRIKELHNYILGKYKKLDILINNAGILLDDEINGLDVDLKTVRDTMETNFYGPLMLCQTFIPLMKENNYGRIVNFSSGLGSLNDMGGNYLSYRVSKTAINALTRIFSAEVQGSNILINSLSPGWVKTDMGGDSAPRSVEQGAETAVWLALLPDNGPTGKFFQDKKEIKW
jgi:NAD(P)-dependent dehydrogenase (short-subunit alcohol dehydrogenase family)